MQEIVKSGDSFPSGKRAVARSYHVKYRLCHSSLDFGIPRKWHMKELYVCIRFCFKLGKCYAKFLNAESSFWRPDSGRNTSFWLVFPSWKAWDLSWRVWTLRMSRFEQNTWNMGSEHSGCPGLNKTHEIWVLNTQDVQVWTKHVKCGFWTLRMSRFEQNMWNIGSEHSGWRNLFLKAEELLWKCQNVGNFIG